MLKLFAFIIGFGAFQFLQAQPEIPIGSWRTHLNYTRALMVAAAGDRIFCATRNSLFYYDKEDGSVNKLSKTDGLSDLNVSSLSYDPESGYLAIGYENGNLDLVKGNRITNYNAIKNEEFNSLKTINHITFHNGLAYISTDFGMPVLDPENVEIRETYFPGFNGTFLEIYGSAIFSDSIFIATEKGIMAGALDEKVNLIDFRNWKIFDQDDGLSPTKSFLSIDELDGSLYAAAADSLYEYRNNQWSAAEVEISESIRSVAKAEQALLICLESGIIQYVPGSGLTEISDPAIREPQMATVDEGVLWIADNKNGLVNNLDGGFKKIHPSGPATNVTGRILNAGDSLIAIPYYPADVDSADRKAEFFVFKSGEWTNYGEEAPNGGGFPGVSEFTDIAIDPATGIIYFASRGSGVLGWRGGQDFYLIDGLQGKPVTTAAVDANNVLWASAHGESSLHAVDGENNVEEFFINQATAPFIVDILPFYNGDKWLRIDKEEGGGIIVFNEEGGQSRYLTDVEGEGGLSSRAVNELAIDRDEYIWAATDEGIVYFANPYFTLTSGTVDAIYPIFEQRRLLVGESLTSIAVDGGNRKWIGANNGLWLFSDAGEALFHNFTTENSPLLSDNILDIEILGETGEVFIATDRGMISFRSDASKAKPGHKAVEIFPNPVPPDYNGQVGISGLAEDAQIKITDISGKLIRETRAYGGTATWDVSNYRGERASAGIYLIFSASQDGEDTFVGKIAVIN